MDLKSIYMDCQATTPTDPRVVEAMAPYWSECFGNASSQHPYGWQAQMAVDQARERTANLIGASKKQIVFTSGATESNNLALLGSAQRKGTEAHLIASAAEHKSVLGPLKNLSDRGWRVTILPVNRYGQMDVNTFEKAITTHTQIVSVMAANNEVGSLNPIFEIGEICRARKILFHCDATQAAGRSPLDVENMNIDFLSISGHKMYGPKGIGALYVRNFATLSPILFGGTQESGYRPGTLPVPLIVGLGQAAFLAQEHHASEVEIQTQWRKQLLLAGQAAGGILNGHPENRLCNNLSLTFPDLAPEDLALRLIRIALSSGSACSSGQGHPSHVLESMGLSALEARRTIRLGIGRFTNENEVIEASRILRSLSETRFLAQDSLS